MASTSDDSSLQPQPALKAEAVTHARRILAVAGRGPESTRGLIVPLMITFLDAGFHNSVAWYLAPSPNDDPLEVIFSVRQYGADDPEPRRWRDRREIAGVLADAARLVEGSEPVEVWSGNGHGLRRRVLIGGNGCPLRFVTPEANQFSGKASMVADAVSAWGSSAADLDTGSWNWTEMPSASDDATAPAAILALGPGRSAGPPGATTVALDSQALATALQEALGQVRVEVDLGAVEEVVADSLRAAFAELPATTPSGSRALASGGPRSMTEVSPGEGARAAPASDLWATEVGVGGPATASAELERRLRRAVAAAVESSLADQLPALLHPLVESAATTGSEATTARPLQGLAGADAELPGFTGAVAEQLSAAVDAGLARQTPHLVNRLASSTASLMAAPQSPPPDLEGLVARCVASVEAVVDQSVTRALATARQAGPDPTEEARRAAASILSPAEIAETLVFRLRPFLEERSDGARSSRLVEATMTTLAAHLHTELEAFTDRVLSGHERLESLAAEVAEAAGRPGLVADEILTSVEDLATLIDRRLQRLEDEVRRQASRRSIPATGETTRPRVDVGPRAVPLRRSTEGGDPATG